MNRIIKMTISLVVAVALIFYSFAQFGHALVDYSLESLGIALKATEHTEDDRNILGKHVYQNVLKGMILDEVSQKDLSYENLLLLEAASRSLDQPEELAGVERARFYIGQVQENKKDYGSFLEYLKYMFNQFLMRTQYIYSAWIAYIKNKMLPQREESFQISDAILLNKAQEKEKQNNLPEAKELYKQYLEIYRSRPDSGLVSLSLANILILQQEWDEAKKLLEEVQTDFFNKEEGRVAMSMFKNLQILKDKNSAIDKHEKELAKIQDGAERFNLFFKLGLDYLAVQNLEKAEESFKTAQQSPDPELKSKATFYLGWTYKLKENHDLAGETLESLLNDKNIHSEMKLALQAQLADIFMQKGDLDKARYYYQQLAENAQNTENAGINAQSWMGLADIEQSVVSVQKGDNRSLDRLLDRLAARGIDEAAFLMLSEKLGKAKGLDFRAEAFRKLLLGETHEAVALFERHKAINPDDAWTYSGLATADYLLEEMEEAHNTAAYAHQILSDEYTASLLGYVAGNAGNHEEAIRFYLVALRHNGRYIPARYNLTCEYLKIREYEKAHNILIALHQEFKYSKNEVMRARILNNIGVCLWGKGQKHAAYDYFKEAILINPRFVKAEENMKMIRLGETPDVITDIGIKRGE